jgi:hypothetical protein
MTKWKLVPVEPTSGMIKAGADVDCIITGIDEIDAPEDYKRVFTAMLEAAPQPPKLSDKRLFHYAAEIRKALEPDPVGATLNIVALLRAIEREILGGDT